MEKLQDKVTTKDYMDKFFTTVVEGWWGNYDTIAICSPSLFCGETTFLLKREVKDL